MRKKLFSLGLVFVMMMSLVACGGTEEETATEVAEEESGAVSFSNELKEPSDIKIGIVLDVGGVNDGSFNQLAWEGLERAMADMGVAGEYKETTEEGAYAENINYFINNNCDLIICVGFMLADATREAALAHPEQKFAIIDDSSNADLPNVECLMFKQEQCSYLVGYVAGLTTQTNTVGFELGMASEAMHLFGYGYCAGVLDANPGAKIVMRDAESFGDLDLGAKHAEEMIEEGADIIFHAAGGTGVGVINACADKEVYAIGVDSDQHAVAEGTVITSAMKRVDNAVYNVVNQVVIGIFQGGVESYNITTGGVDIAPTTEYLSPEVLTAVEKVKEAIINEEIVIPTSQSEFEASYGMVYTLD